MRYDSSMNGVFLARAKQLRSARELVEDDAGYASATALLAVHTGIALNDALLLVWSGKPLKGKDHRASVRATEAQCRLRKLQADGVRHLSTLVQNKSAVSYGDEPVTQKQALALAEAAKRFEAWTFKNCKELVLWDQQQ